METSVVCDVEAEKKFWTTWPHSQQCLTIKGRSNGRSLFFKKYSQKKKDFYHHSSAADVSRVCIFNFLKNQKTKKKHKTIEKSSLGRSPAFVRERVKGFFWSAVARQWRMGLLFCPEVLGVRGLQGKALWCHKPALAGLSCCSLSQGPFLLIVASDPLVPNNLLVSYGAKSWFLDYIERVFKNYISLGLVFLSIFWTHLVV